MKTSHLWWGVSLPWLLSRKGFMTIELFWDLKYLLLKIIFMPRWCMLGLFMWYISSFFPKLSLIVYYFYHLKTLSYWNFLFFSSVFNFHKNHKNLNSLISWGLFSSNSPGFFGDINFSKGFCLIKLLIKVMKAKSTIKTDSIKLNRRKQTT